MSHINRRSFFKMSSALSFGLVLSPGILASGKRIPKSLINATERTFPLLEVKGSHYDIGYATGKTFSSNIREFLRRREDWFRSLVQFVDEDKGDYYGKLKKTTEERMPQLIEELKGIADGARIHYDELLIMNLKSELAAMRALRQEENPGCSTIHVSGKNERFFVHNEDGHVDNSGFMFMLKATPPSGVTFATLVYPGLLPGNGPGINSEGFAFSTNFIGCLTPKVGLPRYFLNRWVVESRDIKDAVKRATLPRRAFAFHHNFGSFKTGKMISIETTPDTYDMRETEGIYMHTNHNILPKTKDFPQDRNYVSSSSSSRFEVLSGLLEKVKDIDDLDEEKVVAMLSSHRQAPYSPCRHPHGDVKGITLGTAAFNLKDGYMRIYKGNPCMAMPNGRTEKFKP